MSPADSQPGVLQRLGVFFLLLFLFLSYSRLTDAFLANLYLPLVTSLLALLFTIVTGGLPRALFSRVGLWLAAFSGWLVLATPFSFWPGGSVQFLVDQWLKSFLVFVIVAGLPQTTKQCRLLMYGIGFATITIVLMCLLIGTTSIEGRLILEQGVLANPNDLAQLLLMGVPFLLLMSMGQGRFPLRRVAVTVSIGAVLIVTGATGSRGALLAFACLIFVMFLNLSLSGKLKFAAALALALPLVVGILSANQRERYLTTFGGQSGENGIVDVSAIESRMQRLDLLQQSLRMTFASPLVGVGPGVFQAASADESESEGQRATWRETHNAYTQVSSEAGLPALGFYLAALLTCLTQVRRTHTLSRQMGAADLANVSYCLWLSLISFAVASFFNSVAYHMYFPTLAGLTVALRHCAALELDPNRVQTATAASAETPAPHSFRLRPRPPAAV